MKSAIPSVNLNHYINGSRNEQLTFIAAVILLTGVYFINMKRDPRVYLRARAMKRLK